MMVSATVVGLVLLGSYVTAGYGCPSNLTQSGKTRKVFLDFHNEVRWQISTGVLRSKYGYLGPAKNMYKLKWDCDLEELAQNQIKTCTFKVEPGSCLLSMSQNSVSMRFHGGDVTVVLEAAQRTWMNPIIRYGVTSGNRFYYKIETFGNIANYKNLKLGCAHKICGRHMLVSCIYGTKRIPPMQELWKRGRTCVCDAYPHSFCSNGICDTNQPAGTGTKMTTRRPAVDGPGLRDYMTLMNEVIPEPYPDSCHANNGMTDDVRKIFLKKHNYYRSFVAKGLAKDKFGGNAPKAARMRKMVYDCDVEASAMRHAEKCRWGHSNKLERIGLGENVWATAVPEMNRSVAAEMSCKSFFTELEKYGVGQDNILTNELFYRQKEQIGHYTQMVWQNSYRLGCVVEYCNTPPAPMTFVVCQYGPGGNFIDQLIYEKGEPCQNDKDCKCANCRCNRNEALCIFGEDVWLKSSKKT